MKNIISLFLICLIIINGNVVYGVKNINSEDILIGKNIDDYLKYIEKYQGFSGNVLVAKEGNILLKKSYGYSDIEKNIPLYPTDKMPIGSVTKEFLATSILQLQERNKLDTKDKISKFFPEYKYGENITIENLLVHNSGIKDFVDYKNILFLNEYENIDKEQIYDKIINGNLNFKAGEKFEYSSSNYFLLSLILEKVTNQSLEQYLNENILTPLQMNDTGIIKSDIKQINVKPYPFFIDIDIEEETKAISNVLGAGYMYSNLDDLYKWDRALNTNKLIYKSSLDKMNNGEVLIRDGVFSTYGFRTNTTKTYGKRVYHTGNTIGFTSSFNRYLDKDVTIILLSNLGEYNIGYFRNDLENIIFNKKVFKNNEVPLNREMIGKYKTKYGVDFEIVEIDNQIYAKTIFLDPVKLFPVSNNKLRSKHTMIELEFNLNEKTPLEVKLIPYGLKGIKTINPS